MKKITFKVHKLALIILSTLCLSFARPASAVSDDDELTLTVHVPLFITVMAEDVNMSASANNFISSTMHFSAKTNNKTGFTSTMTMVKNSTETGAKTLNHDTISSVKIDALGSSVAKASFPTNFWGFSLNDLTYSSVPAKNESPVTILSASTATANSAQDIYFGAKVDDTKPVGTYANEVLITTVANYVPEAATLGSVTYMQDVTNEICANTPTVLNSTNTETPQYQLTDKRDGKTYWVAKLADGHCWMTQNLDFNISTTNVKATDSDVAEDWTTSATYPPVATSSTLFATGTSYNTATDSYDGGDYYWNGTWNPSSQISNLGYSYFSSYFGSTGDSHYHVGNLYRWNAATAGTGGTIVSEDATSSICPKGWRLPTSNSTTADYSFGKLTAAYEIASSAAGVTKLTGAPLFFVPAGYVASSKLYYGAYSGRYWSSMAYSSTSYARSLSFNSSSISSDSYYQFNGYSVRCVAEERKPYTISYRSNTTSSVSNLPADTTSTTHGTTATISTLSPSRSGYQFLGWSTSSTATAASYQPGATIDISAGAVVLHAIWRQNPVMMSSPNPTSDTPEQSGTNGEPTADSGYAAPQGEVDYYDGDSWRNNVSVALGVTAVASTSLFLIILAKRKKDDEEDEENPTATH